MRGKLFFIWTQRPLLKIMNSIKNKLIRKITDKIGEEYENDVANALGEGGDIENAVMQMVENEEIELMDENQAPLIKKQLSKMSNNQGPLANEGDDILSDENNIRVMAESPDASRLEEADL